MHQADYAEKLSPLPEGVELATELEGTVRLCTSLRQKSGGRGEVCARSGTSGQT